MTMMTEIMFVAMVVSVGCALPGVFLVLRGMTMLSDAITHSVLLGIVLAFFVTQDLSSPLLFIGAVLIGIVTVWLTEALQKTNLMKKDAAIGLVYPLFFSIAIILISRYAGHVHLDVDSVMMGEIGFTPFTRFSLFGLDLGPQALWINLFIFLLNALLIVIFYKELQVSTFHPAYAAALGFSPTLIHYGLMTSVSVTAVGAYDSVGSILVVGFMVGPAVTAYLHTKTLKKMIGLTIVVAIFNSLVGVYLAFQLDVAIAGMIALVTGISAFVSFLLKLAKQRLLAYI